MRRLALVCLTTACGRIGFPDVAIDAPPRGDAVDASDDAGEVDAMLDAPEVAMTDAPATCASWTARHFDPCAVPSPQGALALNTPGTYVYDTSTAILTAPGGGTSMPATILVASGRLISVDAFNITATATLRVVGPRPLIVASWTMITINGGINASSATGPGAGSNPTGCASHLASTGQNEDSGAGGGGGGAFRGAGARGGNGEGGAGGNGGSAIAVPLLYGGCNGAEGGTAGAGGRGAGGAGGGAIQLTAHDSITITGVIQAGGGGGGGGDNDAGGGGGGAGGMIGLEAPTVMVNLTAVLAANGGGGGGGADGDINGLVGVPASASAVRAPGGRGGDNGDGGDGGDGSAAASLGGTAGGIGGGAHAGGGGGGGAGYIVAVGTSVSTLGTTSPDLSPP